MTLSPLDSTAQLRIRRDVRYRLIDGEAVVLRQELGEALVLNEVGARILQLADQLADLPTVLSTLAQEFEAAPGEIEADCREFVAGLTQLGILETLEPLEQAAGG